MNNPMMQSVAAIVRRKANAGGGFDPLSLSPYLWLDASDASTLYDATTGGSLVAADGTIKRWEDKSGNADHATQGTTGDAPLRKTAIINGLDVVRFDGAGDKVDFPRPGISTPTTWFVVSKTSDTQYLTIYDPAGSAQYFDATESGSGDNAANIDGTLNFRINGAAVASPTRGNFFTARGSAVNVVVANGPSAASTNCRLMGYSGFDAAIDVCEILAFPALTAGEIETVETYLNDKWAIF